MNFDDTERAERLAKVLASTLEGFRQTLPAEGDLQQISVLLAREQTAALMTLLALAVPRLQDLNLTLVETNARLENIEGMLKDLWAAHS